MSNITLTGGGVISSPDVSKLVTPSVLSDGSLWKLIFYHDCRNGTVLFSSAAEAQHCDEPYKYSILDEMDKFRRSDGAYEFLLYYPEISATKYNRWSQTINPTAEFLGDGGDDTKKVEGYTAIHVDYTDVHWGGLERQNSDATSTNACYLNGSCNHNNWFYAIGSYEKWFDGMPGPDSAIAVNKVFLYQRADTGTTRIYNNRIASEDLNEY